MKTKFDKDWVLKNIPTRILLKAWLYQRPVDYKQIKKMI